MFPIDVLQEQISKVAAAALDVQAILEFPPPSSDFIRRYMACNSCSEEHANALYSEAKKFLMLCASNSRIGFTPSRKVDCMWQHFMCWPEQYLEFCKLLRCPLGLQRRSWLESPHISYEETCRRFAEIFGICDERFWHFCAGTIFCGG